MSGVGNISETGDDNICILIAHAPVCLREIEFVSHEEDVLDLPSSQLVPHERYMMFMLSLSMATSIPMRTALDRPPAFDDVAHGGLPAHHPGIRSSHAVTSSSSLRIPEADLLRRATIAGPLATLAEYADDEEELPDYEEVTTRSRLPGYEERYLLEPVVSYNIYQIDRKLQILTPASRALFGRPRYRVTARSGIFSKKADCTLTRLPTGAAAAAERTPGKEVALINFSRSGQLPWMPRATVRLVTSQHEAGVDKMEPCYMSAPNFSDWKFDFLDDTYFWRLTDKPIALSLFDLNSGSIVARFTYSARGTDASRGAEMGMLDIFGSTRSDDVQTIELVLGTLQVPINHWKNLGRHYKNNINCNTAGQIASGATTFTTNGNGEAVRRASNIV